MAKYIIRRVLQAIPVLIGITIVVYAILLAAPGGPTARFANNPRVTLADREKFKKAWGLDQAIPVQYCRWMGFCNPSVDGTFLVIFPRPNAFLSDSGVPHFLPAAFGGGTNGILHGDLGISISTGEKVVSQIQRAVLPTIILAGSALFIWIALALFIGVYAAIRRYSLFDQAATIFAYIGYAMPTFWLGLMLIFTFAGPGLDILPAQGMINSRLSPPFGTDLYWKYFAGHPIDAILDVGKHLIMPVITLVVVNIAGDSRFVRASMLEAMSQDYVRTARAKGLPGRVVIFRHALRNAMLPVVTNIGLEIPFLFTGAIVTETIFNWPGIGNLTIDATRNFDYPTLMGLLLIAALVTVLANLIADVAYAFVDPRIKY
ncbi:MAG: peptide/nickel transport system permease protein [Chloroflexota bacterium]|jgi:peptide/nickel transport system permease protein|nr:peptide/nickel transport system permease protein [Chloroflexota bacterium]